MTDEPTITIADFRACGVCKDARFWFDANGLNWRAFVRNGIKPSELRATGDQAAKIDKLEAAAMKREARNG